MKYLSLSHKPKLFKRKLVAVISSLALCFPCFTGGISAYAAESIASSISETDAQDNFDAPTTDTLSPAHFISAALGKDLPPEEIAWLEQEAAKLIPSLSLSFDCRIPHDLISLTFPRENQTTVSASPYVGETLGTVWTPMSVVWNGQQYPLTHDGNHTYVSTIDTTDTDLVTVEVIYTGTLSLSLDNTNTLLNAAYLRAKEIADAYTAYEQALSEHGAATEAYQAYRAALQVYTAELSLYQAYLAEKTRYEQKEAAYQAYLTELSAYEQRLSVYEAYLTEKAAYDQALADYTEYVTHPEIYEQKYIDYCRWLEDMDKIAAQLVIIDSCFIRDSGGHVLNSTLNGPTVATVVARQDELVSVGCDAKDISNADAATKALISLLAGYPKKGTDAERYAYYIRHYADIRDNVTLLYTSLSRLYGNDAVPDILEMQGRKERYWQFVAQLYSLSCALEDTIVFDKNWSISDGKLTELLEDCFILEDRNAAAPLAAYPAHMDEVVPPGMLTPPVPPTVVEKPVAPLKVAQPTPPAVVKKPVLPTVVPAPGKAPVSPQFNAKELALYRALENGTLTERSPLQTAVDYPLSLSVGKSACFSEYPVASFYAHDHMTLLYSVVATEGGQISFPAEPPTRPSQAGHTYRFSGWMDDTGAAYPDTQTSIAIQRNTAFYAVYATETEHFTITWDIGGNKTQTTYPFGEIPAYAGTPYKPSDEQYVYEFEGWSPAISPVSENATYTAVFTAHKRTYTIQWMVNGQTNQESYESGILPIPPATPADFIDGRYLHRFIGWSPAISEVTSDAIYTAHFKITDLFEGIKGGHVKEDGSHLWATYPADHLQGLPIANMMAYAAEKQSGLMLEIGHFKLSFDEDTVSALSSQKIARISLSINPTFSLSMTDSSGQLLHPAEAVRINITLQDGQSGRIITADGEIVSSLINRDLTANLTVGETYRLYIGYMFSATISVPSESQTTGGLCVIPDHPVALGEIVTVQVKPAPGYRLKTVIFRDKWGAIIPTQSEDQITYTLTMPDGNVSVSATFVPLTYTVTFMADGNILSSAIYRYGEAPTIPPTPIRESDDQFSYTFMGWSPTVTAVMGDATYKAEFMAIPIERNSSVEDSGIGILELFFIGFGAFAVSCAGVLVPYLIVIKKNKAKLKNLDSPEKEV